MNTGWWEIDIHGCCSLVKITFASIGTCKTMLVPSRSRDVTGQLNYVTMLSQKRPSLATIAKWAIEESFLAELCIQDIKQGVRNKIIHSLPWITTLGLLMMRFANDCHSWLRHSWKSLANRLIRDPKIVIRDNSCIILNFFPLFCRFNCSRRRRWRDAMWFSHRRHVSVTTHGDIMDLTT